MWIQVVLIIFAILCRGSRRPEGELILPLADGNKIPVVFVWVFNLCFGSRILILEDCLYLPNVHRNLISATYLGRHGYCVILKENVVIKKDKVFICSGNIAYGLYIITPDKHELYIFELDNNSHVKESHMLEDC